MFLLFLYLTELNLKGNLTNHPEMDELQEIRKLLLDLTLRCNETF